MRTELLTALLCLAPSLIGLQSDLMAKPARRMIMKLVQPDGTELQVMRSGDEHATVYTDMLSGLRLTQDANTGYWRAMTDDERLACQQQYEQRRADFAMQMNVPKNASAANSAPTLGHHRLPCLLVSWKDCEFSDVWKQDSVKYSSINDLYEDMLNGGTGYTFSGAYAAVNQYFSDMSYGQYEAEFDIIGPVQISRKHSSVGNRNYNVARAAWTEALDSAYAQGLITVDMIDSWDNDGDGYVDLLYVFGAGYSHAEDEDNNAYLWPHQWALGPKRYGNAKARFYKYSCSTELMGACTEVNPDGTPVLTFDAIGSCAHEFGHALGLPDFYETQDMNEGGVYGMQAWSNMDAGCYNGLGHYPPAYTVHERMLLDWVEPMDLPESGTITLSPFDASTTCYILRNPANENEYLTFECRRMQSWDTYFGCGSYFYPSSKTKVTDNEGLFITHVDYDANIWFNNNVNVHPAHERCNPMPADGHLYAYADVTTSSQYTKFRSDLRGELFSKYSKVTGASCITNPYMRWFTTHEEQVNDSVTETVRDNIELVISNVTLNSDGSVSFDVLQADPLAIDAIEMEPAIDQRSRLIVRDGQLMIERGSMRFDLQGRLQ